MKKINPNQSESVDITLSHKLDTIKTHWHDTVYTKNEEIPSQEKQMPLQGNNNHSQNAINANESNEAKNQIIEPPMVQAPLNWKQKIRQIPVLGYIAAVGKAFLKLPQMRLQLAQNTQLIEEQKEAQNNALQQCKQELDSLKEAHLSLSFQTTQVCTQMNARLDRYDALDIGKRLMQFDQMQLERHNKSIKLMMQSHNESVKTLYTRIEKLENTLNSQIHLKINSSLHHPQNTLQTVNQPSNVSSIKSEASIINNMHNDTFYADFEEVFRGSRADIKERLTIYLPYIKNIPLDQNNNQRVVIDIGCGRGEWLELLHESGIQAMGVDLNAKMVDICLEQGLYARCADAIQVLREQTPGSVGAITGFHIIEHLPFELLIAMFDAALQALCVDGVIIFETPNPENLKVGACNFYFDPTHLNPIVPQVAEFMAKQRGFAHAEILRIHPYPEDHLLKGDSPVEKLINKELFGPQDYAVIGRK